MQSNGLAAKGFSDDRLLVASLCILLCREGASLELILALMYVLL